MKQTLREKCPIRFISGPYFPLFSPNTGECGPEITLYLDTFHAVKYHKFFNAVLIFTR